MRSALFAYAVLKGGYVPAWAVGMIGAGVCLRNRIRW